jgi:hypothetical protein
MKKNFPVNAVIRPNLYRFLGIWMIALLIVGLVFSYQPVMGAQAAGQATCTSTASGDWSGAIWSCPGGPGSGDDVIIAHDVELSTDKSAHSLSILADSSFVFKVPVTLSLTGDMTVDVDGIFDPGNDFESTGGTVVFSGTNQSINTNGKWVDFYNLTKIATTPSTLAFSSAANEEDGIHILNNMTLKGTSAVAILSLKSVTPGAVWQVSVEKSLDVNFVDVRDSTNKSPVVNQPIVVEKGKSSGNVTGWTINTVLTTTQFFIPIISK